MKKMIVLPLLTMALMSFGQDTSDSTIFWKKGGTIAVNLTQVSLTNWAAGGQNSSSATGLVSLFAKYKKETFTFDNTLDLAYGLLKQGKSDFVKSDDRIEFSSKAGLKAFNDQWYYSALVSFRTQFADGYKNPFTDTVKISAAFAPAYILASIGMDYKPNDDFSLFISPITSKMTIVNDEILSDAGAFGVDPGATFRGEFGGYVKAAYSKKIMENVSLGTKIDLFSNYLENPQNIDVNWDLVLGMKVNKYISASITTNLIYDDDIDIAVDNNDDGVIDAVGPRTQFKEVLGVGFSYQF